MRGINTQAWNGMVMQRDGGRVVRAVATGWRWVWVSEDAASHVHGDVPGVATTLGGTPTPGWAPQRAWHEVVCTLAGILTA